MDKIYISPSALSAIAKEAKSSEELITLYNLIKDTIHPYQRGWLQEQIYKLQIKEQSKQGKNND